MVADALGVRLDNGYLVRFGRRGQHQYGIDGLDPTKPRAQSTVWQSTLQSQRVLEKIADDLTKVDGDPRGQPGLFVVALGMERDAKLQIHLQDLSETRVQNGRCPLLPLFWDDICADICSKGDLATKWFPTLYPPAPREPSQQVHEDDLLVLAALVEHRSEQIDDLEPWQHAPCGVEVAIRTGLPTDRLNDAVEILNSEDSVDLRPFGPGERGASPFNFQRLLVTAKGLRAFRAAPTRPVL